MTDGDFPEPEPERYDGEWNFLLGAVELSASGTIIAGYDALVNSRMGENTVQDMPAYQEPLRQGLDWAAQNPQTSEILTASVTAILALDGARRMKPRLEEAYDHIREEYLEE